MLPIAFSTNMAAIQRRNRKSLMQALRDILKD